MSSDKTVELADLTKIFLPVGTLLGAAIAIALVGVGPGILVLTGGMLLGAIALVWSSLRSLGESDGVQVASDWEHSRVETSADETKLSLLRTLKDLDQEHSLGKLNDADYEQLKAKYRSQLKDVLREMDSELTPHLAAAEELAAKHLAANAASTTKTRPAIGAKACRGCSQSNEQDAVFCKKCGAKLLAESENDATS